MTDILKQKVETLFSQYLAAFKAYNLNESCACYHLPCTLNTPDKVVLVENVEQCRQELNDIFTQLKQEKTSEIIAQKASFMQINENLLLVCIDWDFLDSNKQIFADFSAFYHITIISDNNAGVINQTLKIVNVVSHELANSISLTHSFSVIAKAIN